MKGGKEEDEIMGPLFPRLRVSDTDKVGRRAPPRNKMALYERLSIPSQRFNSMASTLPLPPHDASTVALSASSSQGCRPERSLFSSFYMPPLTLVHSSKRVCSRSSDGKNLNASRMEVERKNMSNGTLNKGLATECSSRHQYDPSAQNYCGKKLDNDYDFKGPTFIDSGIAAYSQKRTPVALEKVTPLYADSSQKSFHATFNSSIQCLNFNGMPLEQTNTSDMKSRNIDRSSKKQPKNTIVIKEPKEKSVPEWESGRKFGEPSKLAKVHAERDHTSTINNFNKTPQGSALLCEESCGNGSTDGSMHSNKDTLKNGDASRVRNESCSKGSLGNSHMNSNLADDRNREDNDKENGSLELGDADREDEASMMDPISSMDISPDDVVGVIGAKQFWKARRAIVNQQRLFAMQVFELHRLIKVQKLIAASPHLLLEGSPYLSKSPAKVLTKILPLECPERSQLQTVHK